MTYDMYPAEYRQDPDDIVRSTIEMCLDDWNETDAGVIALAVRQALGRGGYIYYQP